MKFSRLIAAIAICAACAVPADPPTGARNVPVGPITPGSPTTITPDGASQPYASIQGPSPTMNVVAQDLLDLSLVVLNIQNSMIFDPFQLGTRVIGTPGVITSGRVYVDGYGWYGYTSATPYVADGLNVVTSTGMGGGQWVHESVKFDDASTITPSSPTNVASRTVTSRAYVRGFGWYDYRTGSPFTIDNTFVLPATAIGSGQWVHELLELFQRSNTTIATVGPNAVDSGAAPNRINRNRIDHGYLTHAMLAGGDLTTTSASLVDVQNINLGPLLANDIIKAHLPAIAGCTAAFRAATYLSVDGGGTYFQFSPGSTFTYPGSVGPITIVPQLDFYHALSGNSTGDVHVSIRIQSNGSALLTLSLGPSMIEVIRP